MNYENMNSFSLYLWRNCRWFTHTFRCRIWHFQTQSGQQFTCRSNVFHIKCNEWPGFVVDMAFTCIDHVGICGCRCVCVLLVCWYSCCCFFHIPFSFIELFQPRLFNIHTFDSQSTIEIINYLPSEYHLKALPTLAPKRTSK